ncbi:unnamed protein product [Mytilus coruscus]|uniref:CCHC-type domain-containing protein n=1 Tax=Mytilus coruscus TaxID=42192 RepID=A0A6J8CJY4_MYTCO|nr:unnamed protein product [Mytilus coruscus]
MVAEMTLHMVMMVADMVCMLAIMVASMVEIHLDIVCGYGGNVVDHDGNHGGGYSPVHMVAMDMLIMAIMVLIMVAIVVVDMAIMVFSQNHISTIVNNVKQEYPNVYSSIHDGTTNNLLTAKSSPCPFTLSSMFILSCIIRKCRDKTTVKELIQSDITNGCNAWNKLNQDCIIYVGTTGLANNAKQVNRHGKLIVEIAGRTIVCTKMQTALNDAYYELSYNNLTIQFDSPYVSDVGQQTSRIANIITTHVMQKGYNGQHTCSLSRLGVDHVDYYYSVDMSDNEKNPNEDMDEDTVEDTVGEDDREYLSDELASDSEDEKRIRAADSRAVKKIKAAKTDKQQHGRIRPVEAAGSSYQQAHSGGNSGGNGLQPFRAGASAGGTQGQQSPAKPSDVFYKCGFYGHWERECRRQSKNRVPRAPPS